MQSVIGVLHEFGKRVAEYIPVANIADHLRYVLVQDRDAVHLVVVRVLVYVVTAFLLLLRSFHFHAVFELFRLNRSVVLRCVATAGKT
jgi:hypothetical protein